MVQLTTQLFCFDWVLDEDADALDAASAAPLTLPRTDDTTHGLELLCIGEPSVSMGTQTDEDTVELKLVAED